MRLSFPRQLLYAYIVNVLISQLLSSSNCYLQVSMPKRGLFYDISPLSAFDTLCIAHAHVIPIFGDGKREAYIDKSMVIPAKVAPVTRTTLMTTGPVPVDSRQ